MNSDLEMSMSFFNQSEQMHETVCSGNKQNWSSMAEHWHMFSDVSVSATWESYGIKQEFSILI